jgi:hypothetical protein
MKMILAILLCSTFGAPNTMAQQGSSEPKSEKQGTQAMCPMHDAHSQMKSAARRPWDFRRRLPRTTFS